jgi:hypothetical protein
VGKKLRILIGGERSKILVKVARFGRLRIPHRVVRLVERTAER